MNDRGFTCVYFSFVALGCYILRVMGDHHLSSLIYVPYAIAFSYIALHVLKVRLEKNRNDGHRG